MACYLIIVTTVILSLADLIMGRCDIEIQGFGREDPNCPYHCPVYIRLNQHPSYLKEQAVLRRGIHLGLVNMTSCSLKSEPVLCDLYGDPVGNDCLTSQILASATADPDELLVMSTGM